jgi:hypothetical protein
MEPEVPTYESVVNYPADCKARFLAACAKRAEARYHAVKKTHFAEAEQAIDDYLLWLSIYQPE